MQDWDVSYNKVWVSTAIRALLEVDCVGGARASTELTVDTFGVPLEAAYE